MWRLYKFFTNPRALLPFLINQSGSIVFYYILASEKVSDATTICNSLTFAFTALTAYVLGEKINRPWLLLIGVSLVMIGIYFCLSWTTLVFFVSNSFMRVKVIIKIYELGKHLIMKYDLWSDELWIFCNYVFENKSRDYFMIFLM